MVALLVEGNERASDRHAIVDNERCTTSGMRPGAHCAPEHRTTASRLHPQLPDPPPQETPHVARTPRRLCRRLLEGHGRDLLAGRRIPRSSRIPRASRSSSSRCTTRRPATRSRRARSRTCTTRTRSSSETAARRVTRNAQDRRVAADGRLRPHHRSTPRVARAPPGTSDAPRQRPPDWLPPVGRTFFVPAIPDQDVDPGTNFRNFFPVRETRCAPNAIDRCRHRQYRPSGRPGRATDQDRYPGGQRPWHDDHQDFQQQHRSTEPTRLRSRPALPRDPWPATTGGNTTVRPATRPRRFLRHRRWQPTAGGSTAMGDLAGSPSTAPSPTVSGRLRPRRHLRRPRSTRRTNQAANLATATSYQSRQPPGAAHRRRAQERRRQDRRFRPEGHGRHPDRRSRATWPPTTARSTPPRCSSTR